MTSLPAQDSAPYATPRNVTDIASCYLYHSIDLPGVATPPGEWDLRPGIDAYLGHYDFAGRRVLDVGAASGFLSFHAEKRGAEVVSYDLSDEWEWDVVPHAGAPVAEIQAERRRHMRRLNDGYWFCHAVLKSRAKVVYGTVYDIPASIGPVDVALYGAILPHLRDPFLGLQNGCRLAREAVIVSNMASFGRLDRFLRTPRFMPNHRHPEYWDTWWALPPSVVQEYLAILGFPRSTVTFHRQLFLGKPRWLYTVVARR